MIQPDTADGTAIHRRIASALAELADPTGSTPPHPYIGRHLIEHAHLGDVLDDAHVPASVLPWEHGAKVHGMLGIPPPSLTSGSRLAAWSRIEPFLGGADIPSRAMSLSFACASAGIPVPDSTSAHFLTPTWARWRLPPNNVLAATRARVSALVTLQLPGGRVLLASGGSGDKSVLLWDPLTGTRVGEPLIGHRSDVTALVALPLGESLMHGFRRRL